MSKLDELLESLPHFDFHVEFAQVLASASAGAYLSCIFDLCGRADDPAGWLPYSLQDVRDSLGIRRGQQELYRRKLRLMGILEEKLEGLPARLYFRLNFEVLAQNVLALGAKHCDVADEDRLHSILKIYKSVFNTLSNGGYKRGLASKVDTVFVDYAEVFLRDRGICHICKEPIIFGPASRKRGLQFDHAIPIIAGGPHTYENVFASHAECNLRKSDRMPMQGVVK